LGREIHPKHEIIIASDNVSIRSRLLGREILIDGVVDEPYFMFQSAPGFWAGRYFVVIRSERHLCCFNPLPAFGPGDTWILPLTGAANIRFNPLPAFGPGDTLWYTE